MRQDLSTHPLLQSPLLRNRLLTHLLFWVTYVVIHSLIIGGGDNQFKNAFTDQLLLLPVKLVAVYFTLYILIPNFLLERRYWSFGILMITMLVVAGLIQRSVIYYVVYPLNYPDFELSDFGGFFHYQIIRNVLVIVYVIVIASVIKITKLWYQDQRRAESLVKDNLEAELKFLKAQIHPHFLFNTLNNLYSLTLKKSDHAPEVVLRLSGLVNYMLYDASAARVSLSREIECIHNYIALEKIRYGQTLDVFFDVSGNITGTQIAPLLLLPFVENSFKHGVSDEIKEKWITVNLNVNNEYLTFKVENGRTARTGNVVEKDYAGGIGLKNVRRRLELLYPDRYELKILEEENAYLVNLKIILE